jgi:hypothetical protein
MANVSCAEDETTMQELIMDLWNYRSFPSDKSFLRLGVSILIDINEGWLTTKKYLSMDMD